MPAGRSPRARRRRLDEELPVVGHGSISACAEETMTSALTACRRRVDLRVRGGDVTTREPSAPVVGRSPRARRRRTPEDRRGVGGGSISACAEETRLDARR